MASVVVEKTELKEKEDNKAKEWLHFVGARLYSLKLFVEESRKHGVQRAIPLRFLKRLKWRDRIFLAFPGKRKEEKAFVFGFFRLTNISYKASENFMQRLTEKLKVTGFEAVGKSCDRVCGSYNIVSFIYVQNTIQEIYEAVKQTIEETGEKPKIFIGGELVLIEPFELQNVPFTRALTSVEIPSEKIRLLSDDLIDGESRMTHLENYHQRKYLTKSERVKVENKVLSDYTEE